MTHDSNTRKQSVGVVYGEDDKASLSDDDSTQGDVPQSGASYVIEVAFNIVNTTSKPTDSDLLLFLLPFLTRCGCRFGNKVGAGLIG
jgi:hypothetical protein